MLKQKLQCPFCSKISSRGTGLASHIRGAHSAEYADWSSNRKSGPPARATSSPARPAPASGGFKDIVATLQRQHAAIERALAALRALDGGDSLDAPAAPAVVTARPAKTKRKGGMTAEGKARLIAALKRRWAEKKAAAAGSPAAGKRGRKSK